MAAEDEDSPSLVGFGFDELKLDEIVAGGSLDFDDWTALISQVESRYPGDRDKICMVYDSFLSKYPLCYGYWKKYADHKANMCTLDEVVEVFERAVESAAYSVDVWVDYCSFGVSFFEDPLDICRLFKRALLFVGKDYLCHTLWDKYIQYEFSQQHWSSLAHIYILALKFPTRRLHQYYESFKKLVSIWEEELKCEDKSCQLVHLEAEIDAEATAPDDDEICHVITNLLDPSTRSNALEKYLSIGTQFYRKACQLDTEIHFFEKSIHRPYFHVKPLDDHQLDNWHQYLDFIEEKGEFDWAVKLYERCLIPCANYPEFWMRYVEYVESKGGREIANDTLERATQIFLKCVPAIHLISARFKEQIGDIDGARAAFLQCGPELGSYFVESVMRKANMEKRLGNYAAASAIYKEAIKAAMERKLEALPLLYVHFSRLEYMMTHDVYATQNILLDGIRLVPDSKLLLEELIKFSMMHEGAQQVNILDSVIADALSLRSDVSPGLSARDREDLSRLYFEFIDLCGTIHDSRRVLNRHVKICPHLLRANCSCKPFAGVGITRKIQTDGTADVAAHSEQGLGNHSSDHLIELPTQIEKLSLASNLDQLDQAMQDHGQPEQANSRLTSELVPSMAAKESTDDAYKPNAEIVHQAANDVDSMPADMHYESNGLQQQQEQEKEFDKEPSPLKLGSLPLNPGDDNSNLSPLHGSKAPQELCQSNDHMPVKNDSNFDEIPSICSPLGALVNNSAQRFSESPSPTPRHQSPISTSGHLQLRGPSDLSQDWHGHEFCGRGPSDVGSFGHSEDQVDQQRLLSPRRHSYGLPEGQHYSKQSASPHTSRWNSEDQLYLKTSLSPQHRSSGWHSEDKQRLLPAYSPRRHSSQSETPARSHMLKRHHHKSRYRDSSRVRRGGERQNLNKAAATQTRQMPILQNQSSASTTPSHLPIQLVYPQASMSQYPVQRNQQYAYAQNAQAYAQMWQYYYFQQQQQFFLWQQQLYQQQQQQPQPQEQPPPQHQQQQQTQQVQPHQQQQFLQLEYPQHLQQQPEGYQRLQQQQPGQALDLQYQQLQSYQQLQLQLQQLYPQLQLLQQQQPSDQQTMNLQQQLQLPLQQQQLQQLQHQYHQLQPQQQEQQSHQHQQPQTQQLQKQYQKLQEQQRLFYIQQQQFLQQQLLQGQQLPLCPETAELDRQSPQPQKKQQQPLELKVQLQQQHEWQHEDQEQQVHEEYCSLQADSGDSTQYYMGKPVTHPPSPDACEAAASPQSHQSPQIAEADAH